MLGAPDVTLSSRPPTGMKSSSPSDDIHCDEIDDPLSDQSESAIATPPTGFRTRAWIALSLGTLLAGEKWSVARCAPPPSHPPSPVKPRLGDRLLRRAACRLNS